MAKNSRRIQITSDRIIQLIRTRSKTPEFVEVVEVDANDGGIGGFSSTDQ